MAGRHPSLQVTSLFGQLDALERAMAQTQKFLLETIADPDATSVLGDLREQQDVLETEIVRVVGEIEKHVDDSSAIAVFENSRSPRREAQGGCHDHGIDVLI